MAAAAPNDDGATSSQNVRRCADACAGGPAVLVTRSVIDAQNLNDIPLQSTGNNEGHVGDVRLNSALTVGQK